MTHPSQKLKFVAPQVALKCLYEAVEHPYVGLEHIRSWTGEINVDQELDDATSPEGMVSLFQPGDILFGKLRPYLAKVALMDFAGACSTEALVLRPKPDFEPRFLRYVLSGKRFIDEVNASTYGAKMPRASWEVIGSRFVPTPIRERQCAVADFLDREIANIDRLADKKKRLLHVLDEIIQATITQSVTRGLVENAPIRESGQWFGPIPKHWESTKTKRVFRLVCKPAPDDNDAELLSVYTDIGVRPRKELEQRGNKASTTDGYWIVRRGDIVVNKLLAWMGAIGYSAYDGVTSPAYDILRATRKIEPKFYHYLFRSRLAQRELKRWSRGIMDMRLRLYFQEFGNISIPVPPLDEQAAIVQKIEQLEQKNSLLISKNLAHIKLIQEYREALINAAVTGQIDVATWR